MSTNPFHDLADELDGRVTLREDADFAEVSRPWSFALPTSPLAVLAARDVDDIVAAVRYAAAHGLRVSVQPIGHGATSHLDDTLVIRTGALDGLDVDTTTGIARVGAGVTWGQLQPALDGTGLTGLAGSNSMINVVAYTIGGGYSLLGRAFGNAAATIVSADVVTADGRVLTVTDEAYPGLAWALRGGGGDFAIVTSLEIQLHRSTFSGGRIVFSADEVPQLVDPFVKLAGGLASGTTAIWNRMNLPDLPHLPDHMRGARMTIVDSAHDGPLDELTAQLAVLTDAVTPQRDTLSAREPGELGAICEEPTAPSPGMGRNFLVREITRELLLTLEEVINAHPVLFTVHLRVLGGAMDDPQERPGAYGDQHAAALVTCAGMAVGEQMQQAMAAALDAAEAALQPWIVPGCPLTFLTPGRPIDLAFSPETLARLREIKANVDPQGTIRSNQPVGAPA